MKKKYESKSAKLLRKIFGKDVEEAKPELCPQCGEEMFLLCISCGLLPCQFHYICPKCPREVISDKNGLVENKKLTKEELIKRLSRKEL